MRQRQIIALAVMACGSLFASSTLIAQIPVFPAAPPTNTAPLPAPPMPMGYGPHGKPLYYFMVFSDPTPGQEEEYNRWYDRVHASVVIEGGDFIWAQRFVKSPPTERFGGGGGSDPVKQQYVIIFAAESDNIQKTLEDANRRLALPHNVRSSSLNYNGLSSMSYKAVGPQITQKQAKKLVAEEVKAGRMPALDAPVPPGYVGGPPGRGFGPGGAPPGTGQPAAPTGR